MVYSIFFLDNVLADGCSKNCTIEANYTCSGGKPSVCKKIGETKSSSSSSLPAIIFVVVCVLGLGIVIYLVVRNTKKGQKSDVADKTQAE